jgi:glucokinase
MEIGHLVVVPNGRLCGCGNHGCLEQYASAPGLAATFFELSSLALSANDIAALANQGNLLALQAYDMAGAYLAQALALTLNIVDASQVVIGGGLSGAWPLMERAFHARLQADLIPVLKSRVRVHISTSNDQAGMIGAALLAKSRVELSDNM